MNIHGCLKSTLLALAGLASATTAGLAQPTVLTNSYTNTFDAAGNTAPFTGGSVAFPDSLAWDSPTATTAMAQRPHSRRPNQRRFRLANGLSALRRLAGDQGVF